MRNFSPPLDGEGLEVGWKGRALQPSTPNPSPRGGGKEERPFPREEVELSASADVSFGREREEPKCKIFALWVSSGAVC